MKQTLSVILVYAGLLLILAGIALPFFVGVQGLMYKILYSAGAVMVLTGRILEPNDSPYLRVKRLMRIQIWSGIFFVAGAFFMWYSRTTTDWLAFTLAGGAIQVYVSIALPIVLNKERKEKKDRNA